ncbi:MAG: hypothetical protein QXP81_09720 [Nitrososphaerota archaeon]
MRSVRPAVYVIGPIEALRGSRSRRGLLLLRLPGGLRKSAHVSSVRAAYLCEGGIALVVETKARDYYRWLPRNPVLGRRLGAIGDYFCPECGPSYSPRCDECGLEARPRILWRDPQAAVSLAPAELRGSAVIAAGVRMTPWEVLGLYRDEAGMLYAEVISLRRFEARPVGALLPAGFRRPLEVEP